MKKPTRQQNAIIACAVLALAGILIGIGIAFGQPESVLHKAALVCYECIGLG